MVAGSRYDPIDLSWAIVRCDRIVGRETGNEEDSRDPQEDDQEILDEPWYKIALYEDQGWFLLCCRI